jgi:hypothetical protein
MDARWIAGHNGQGHVSPYDVFRGWTAEARKLFAHYPGGLRVVGDGYDLAEYAWLPKCVSNGGLDGRHAIALVNTETHWGTSLVLRRTIVETESALTLHAQFGDLEAYRSRKRLEPAALPDIAAAASLIIAVDAERMMRRVAEVGALAPVRIAIGPDDLQGDPDRRIIAAVRTHLESPNVRIEPIGWSGPKPIFIAG